MIVWIVFIAVVVFALILDLGVFNRKPHEIKTKEAAIWTSVWVTCALLFSGIVYLSFENKIFSFLFCDTIIFRKASRHILQNFLWEFFIVQLHFRQIPIDDHFA